MSFPKRLALLTFLATMMCLSGAVTLRHLNPQSWDTENEEMILALFWAIGLSAGTFAVCWSCGVLVEWARLLPVPVAARRFQIRRRILALSLLLAFALSTMWLLPAEIQRRRAADYQAPPEELRRIYADPKARDRIEVQAALAAHRNTPSDILLDLAITEDSDFNRPRRNLVALLEGPPWSIWQLVAAQPATPPEGLRHIADNGSQMALEAVAWNPGTPPALLLRLAHNSSPEVLRTLVRNPKTPARALELLAEHPDGQVRAGVAIHDDTPPSVLNRLATDPLKFVRHCVATNSRASLTTLDLLSADPDAEIRRLAQEARDRTAGQDQE